MPGALEMKILIYGAGVLGSYLAHVLVRADNDVTLLARGTRLEELREQGLRVATTPATGPKLFREPPR